MAHTVRQKHTAEGIKSNFPGDEKLERSGLQSAFKETVSLSTGFFGFYEKNTILPPKLFKALFPQDQETLPHNQPIRAVPIALKAFRLAHIETVSNCIGFALPPNSFSHASNSIHQRIWTALRSSAGPGEITMTYSPPRRRRSMRLTMRRIFVEGKCIACGLSCRSSTRTSESRWRSMLKLSCM